MTKPIIEVKGLSKRYKLGVFNAKTLREEAEAFLARFSRGKAHTADGTRHAASGPSTLDSKLLTPSAPNEFWALRDVSFDVQPGEVIGVIGRNGAGKSTLLKILSRITEPTSGEARIRGRVASLLEVGTGFHPELTGRENIFLNGAILGMTKAEIRNKFDEIVAFAEIEKFIDTPVKRYSSGMYVRLAFAVAAHLEPEILIVDEVLAVGDAAFQKKCLGKMQEVSGRDGRTVLFVSHNIGAVQALCTRTLLMANGKVSFLGPTDEACRTYVGSLTGVGGEPIAADGPLDESISIEAVIIRDSHGNAASTINRGESFTIEAKLRSSRSHPDFQCFMGISVNETRICTMKCSQSRSEFPEGSRVFRSSVPGRFLRPGLYQIGIGGACRGLQEWIWAQNASVLEVTGHWESDDDRLEVGAVEAPCVS